MNFRTKRGKGHMIDLSSARHLTNINLNLVNSPREVKMQSLIERRKLHLLMFFFGFLVLAIQGCTTPLVDVKVTTCEQRAETDSEGKGACNVAPVTSSIAPQICKDN